MKTNLLTIVVAIVMIMAGSSCKSNKGAGTEIPFNEYSRTEFSFRAENFSPDDRVIVINNDDDLEKYTIKEDGSFAIDFDRYSLILARGFTTSTVAGIEKYLTSTSRHSYTLYVDVELGMGAHPEGWLILLQVPKLPSNAKVKLIETQHT